MGPHFCSYASSSLTRTLTSYATVAGDTFTGVITFANTIGLGSDTTRSRIILFSGTTTTDKQAWTWYGPF